MIKCNSEEVKDEQNELESDHLRATIVAVD